MDDAKDYIRQNMLDGNSAAGVLEEIFGEEMTASPTECDHCGREGELGSLLTFTQAPGMVLRCPACSEVMLRVVQTPDYTYLDVRGAVYLRLARPAEARTFRLPRQGPTMNLSHKPEGFTTVAPYLIVDGASATIDFLIRVFDAIELQRFPDSSGKILHAEVRIDDTVVMVADGGEGWPPIASQVHVYVPDVLATYRRALEAGATSVQAPEKKDDADQRGGVKDSGGTTWWIATRVE